MNKLDFVARDRVLYRPATEPDIIKVPNMQFLMFDGQGMPEKSPMFQKAFQALYGIAYTIKFMPKKGEAPPGYKDFKMPPPEGLWWMKGNGDFDAARPEDWQWTLLLRVPDFVTPELVHKVIAELVDKKKDQVYRQVRLATYEEGPCVQMLHIGPYDKEGPSLQRMETFAAAHGFAFTGKHHEIYFGDPRRTRPENLKTVLRHPIKPI